MIKVFYNYYHLFYSRLLPASNPRLTALLTLSFSLSLLIIGIIGTILAYTISYALNRYEMFGIFALTLAINYSKYYQNGRAKAIIEEHNMFFNSQKWSIVITTLFFVFTSSILFWGPELIRRILVTR
jgi:hypothetical protein